MLIPRFNSVGYETTHNIHQSAVITLHLAITGRPIRGGSHCGSAEAHKLFGTVRSRSFGPDQ